MKRVLIMAGGTGGHVFPGLAIAKALAEEGVETVWLGTHDGMEQTWVQPTGIPFYRISIKGVRGNGWLGWLAAPFRVTRAWWQARKILLETQPDLVLGMGGFVCGPGGLAAWSLGKKLVLHEQNAIPGMTNKWLAPLAKRVICAFPQSVLRGSNVVTLGNPVRAGLESLSCVLPQTPRRLLVMGGSRGALALNQVVPAALALLPINERPQVCHQTGEKTLSQAQEAYAAAGVDATVTPFIDDMVQAYQAADLVICRSGALTVSELLAAARPAILVPYPHAVDDHQTANAQALVEIGGGEVIQQSALTAETLAERLRFWMDSETCQAASRAIRAQAPQAATQRILAELKRIVASDV
ncbi:MAG: undecaprenyldiphospho-muramoylpentapeptide beta-N-acetylglucosaminyltransferase [Hydrogenovibrio sp.]